MLMPKRVKYRRVQRGRLKGKAMRVNKVTNGSYGLVALEPAWITSVPSAVTTETVRDVAVVLRAQEARELREKEDVNNVNAEES